MKEQARKFDKVLSKFTETTKTKKFLKKSSENKIKTFSHKVKK